MALEIVLESGKKKIICGKIARKTGKPCRNRPEPGRGYCKYHGGRIPVGVRSPHFVTGKHSKYLPKKILEKYNEAFLLDDPYSNRDEIALLDARVMMLTQQMQVTDNEEIISSVAAIRLAVDDYIKDNDKEKDPKVLLKIADEVSEILDNFANERRRWYEIYDVLENRRRLTESEVKRDALAQHQISENQAVVLIAAIVDIMKRHIDDRNTFNSIAAEISNLASRTTSRITAG